MSEGPQVKLRTEWLDRYLTGRQAFSVTTARQKYREMATYLTGRTITACYCKGKHIFIDFNGSVTLHNHLVMKGRWRREPGQFLIVPDDVWLGFYVGDMTICNLYGQVLELLGPGEVNAVLNRLGPDAMGQPFPRQAVEDNIHTSDLPIAEFLLQQELMSGVGNVAKSEILFTAGIDPRRPASTLSPKEIDRLCQRTQAILWEAYHNGGRWTHRVYRRRGQPCPACGGRIQLLRLEPSRRSVYVCPACQDGQ